MVTTTRLLFENALFFVFSLPGLIWGWQRYRDRPRFTGTITPWPAWFKVRFKVIWIVGALVPLLVFVGLGVRGQWGLAAMALGPYFVIFAAQISTELTCIRLASPVWWRCPASICPGD